ncbi:glycosyl transferase family 2 [Pyrobaculum aerophilum]|uniref:Glycosyl transferase family 2 n=1 Tax=Pyrobaculum aerophilum TaxID=13773 RepID=A0A371QXH2_9CREN|nr:glycosyltransferase [Pyrobaculum aerophilum]RFA95249.1 glycosyl transferase family 2 [Pyrobaculum aerophilum]RFA97735.1 glycosyl transferase family 2 [Pyrobaculum aerophilum]
MKVTIGILGKNSEWILKYSLKAVKQALTVIEQSGISFEVIYVDGGSSDRSVDLVKTMLGKDTLIIEAKNTNIPEARNIVVKNAKGDYIVFWDSDILAPPSILLRMIRTELPIVAPEREDVYIRSEEEIEKFLNIVLHEKRINVQIVDVPYVVFSVTAFKKEVFERVGLFDERMTQAEDRDFGLRARCKGYKSYLLRGSVAYDINRRLKSDVPVMTPLRQYARGLLKKGVIYAFSPSPRHKRNMVFYGTLHALASTALFYHPIVATLEMVPLAFFTIKYGFRKGAEMWIKSLLLYTTMIFAKSIIIFKDICGVLEEI